MTWCFLLKSLTIFCEQNVFNIWRDADCNFQPIHRHDFITSLIHATTTIQETLQSIEYILVPQKWKRSGNSSRVQRLPVPVTTLIDVNLMAVQWYILHQRHLTLCDNLHLSINPAYSHFVQVQHSPICQWGISITAGFYNVHVFQSEVSVL